MKKLAIVLVLFLFLFNPALAAPSSPNAYLIAQKEVEKIDADTLKDLDDLKDEEATSISDPLRSFNTAMYHFNDKLYFWLLKPAARVWRAVIPMPFRAAIKNGFNNIRFPIRFVNSLLQGKGKMAGNEAKRFLINTTAGIGGLGDPAKDLGIHPSEEDFGQTLGVWDAGHGFYLVWPFFGPSSLRDTFGLMGDFALDPLSYFTILYSGLELKVTVPLRVGQTVNETSFRIGDYEALKEAAIDPYEAIKDAYLQYRKKMVEQ